MAKGDSPFHPAQPDTAREASSRSRATSGSDFDPKARELLAARFLSKDTGRKLYAFFKQWDTDNNGTLSKREFRHIMETIGAAKIQPEEVELAWTSVDKDASGTVDYYEFLEWLLDPGAQLSLKMDDSGGYQAAPFNLGQVLDPLFEVFDRNSDGVITVAEFKESHAILQGAIKSFVSCGYSAQEPSVVISNADYIFRKVDLDNDRTIQRAEFVAWQREAIRKSGLSNEDLAILLPSLAKQIRTVFKLLAKDEEGKELDSLEEVTLQTVVQGIADNARELWNTQRTGLLSKSKRYPNQWREPPVGLNINRLKAKHLSILPFSMERNKDSRLQVLCVPSTDGKQWLAEVRSKTIALFDGEARASTQFHYTYRRECFSWESLQHGGSFEEALDGLAPEVRFFCLLKTEANLGSSMSWTTTEWALEQAVERGWLTEENLSEFRDAMELQTISLLREEGAVEDLASSPRSRRREVLAEMRTRITIAPRAVMAKLSELGIFPISCVWADFMET